MAAEAELPAIHGRKLSTVVPGSVTGEAAVYELANIDLVMKLHYLRTVYYFKADEIIDSLTIKALKEPMFPWLDVYYPVAGRIRRTEAGRPFVKCNDCGVRIVETKCGQTLEEWLEIKDSSRWRQLVPEKVLGPDLHFSPFVFIQFTRFKCGGMAIGFSWSHILGDAITATNFINLWAQLLSNSPLKCQQHLLSPETKTEKTPIKLPASMELLPVKQVEHVGDSWLSLNNSKMATHSFQITEEKIKQLQAKESGQISSFEIISALIWQCLSKIRKDKGPKSVTICRNDTSAKRSGLLSNEQKISTVVSDFVPSKVAISELASMIAKQEVAETKMIEDLVDGQSGTPDFIVYGANLTFIDMEGVPLYELELKGRKPIHVEYSIDGVGDEGAVLVLQCPQQTYGSGGNGGKMVMLILPEDQIPPLQEELQSAWGVA
ncbi:protein ECERIFERUM 26-like [Phoenix dactylifera]|uniref:Protein ECERIFERUM 26-like n=1 Tax=Phoenix dactylifera TaxID=42345 RepID=A0A8B7CMD6_PHODC|nr:protein ECERIFERUM 26-like [Phoenix dactylifera]